MCCKRTHSQSPYHTRRSGHCGTVSYIIDQCEPGRGRRRRRRRSAPRPIVSALPPRTRCSSRRRRESGNFIRTNTRRHGPSEGPTVLWSTRISVAGNSSRSAATTAASISRVSDEASARSKSETTTKNFPDRFSTTDRTLINASECAPPVLKRPTTILSVSALSRDSRAIVSKSGSGTMPRPAAARPTAAAARLISEGDGAPGDPAIPSSEISTVREAAGLERRKDHE